MGTYNPPVAGLLKLGTADFDLDFLAFGFGREHVPDLIRMLQDKELIERGIEFYAHIHAWRALDQLRAPEAVEPLLDYLAISSNTETYEEWATEELPRILGRFGAAIIPLAVARLEQRGADPYPACYYANVLVTIAEQHPETRAEVVGHLVQILSTTTENDPTFNGFLISDLIQLKATEAWPAIESAYATGNVDLSITGGVDHAKYHLGLGPEPLRELPAFDQLLPLVADMMPRTSAKDRFNQRQRQKKLEKKQKRKKK